MRKTLLRYAAACCWLGVLALNAGIAQAQDNAEHNIKAAYIYNFTKFVEWPGEMATSKRASIDICVVNDGDLMRAADVFKQASTPQLKISLVGEKNPKNISKHCHVVFIGSVDGASANEVLAAVKGTSVLTVSDMDNFVERGGMIGFVMVNNKIKLAVNIKSVMEAGLRIDAQLLEIALKVVDR